MSSCIIFDFQYNIAAVLIYIYTRDGLPWVCTFQYLLYFWLNKVDQFSMAPTNLKKWYLRNGRTQPLIFINNLSPELVINYFIKRVGLSSRSLRAAASGEDHTPPGIDGIRWQPLVAGLGENLPRQGADASYYHFMHENTEIICKMKVHLHRKPIRLSVKRSVLCR